MNSKSVFTILSFILFLASPLAVAKNCTKGKPCGNACISITYNCYVGTITTPTPTCLPSQVLQNNVCVTPTPTCLPSQVLQNNVCVTPTPTCLPPQVLQNNVCVTPTPTCLPPQVLQNNVCVTPTPTCLPPQVLQNNVCVTPTLPRSSPSVPPQDKKVISGDLIALNSKYVPGSIKLSCINTTMGLFNASIIYDGLRFLLDNVAKEENTCFGYSAKYSDLTNLITVLNIGVDNVNYRASFILNGYSLSLIDLKDNSKDRSSTAYNRDDWGDWGNDDGDCFNTRDEVLLTFDQYSTTACNFSAGLWTDPYTGINYTSKSDLDIDHIVPIHYAHDHGAANWPAALKKQFYNDISNLLPVSASVNRSKGDKSPAEWMPPSTSYHCSYVSSFLYVVDKYDLDISPAERNTIKSKCLQ